jgi:hypothetical protein
MSKSITLPENVEQLLQANEGVGGRILLSIIEEMKHEETDSEGRPVWNNWTDGPLWDKGRWNKWSDWRQK